MKNINPEFTTVDVKPSSTKVHGTILVADIANYSGMMRADESATMDLLRNFKSIVDGALASFGGNKIKDTGDGVLMLFSAEEAALSFALKCQRSFIDQSIPVRIGLHSAEVVMEDGDIYGDGVNVAARIEGYSVTGGIFFSETVFAKVVNNASFKIHEVGPVELKNLDRPLDLYALKNEGLIYKREDAMKTEESTSKLSDKLHWIPKSELSKKMANAKKGAALFGTVAFLFGCKTTEDGPIYTGDEDAGGLTESINEAYVASGSLSNAVNDDMSFSEAFGAARVDVGAGGFFEWNGQVYNTNTQSEFEAMTGTDQEIMVEQLDEVVASYEETTEEIVDVADALEMSTITVNGVDVLVFTDDGQVVKIEVDSDGNGTFDMTIADTTGNGQLDTMGLMTTSGTLINTQEVPEPMDHQSFMETVATDGNLNLDAVNEPESFSHYIADHNVVNEFDLDEDGVADTFEVDDDGDGYAEAAMLDLDGNGIAEVMSVEDENGDAYFIEDQNQDGIDDSLQEDSQPDVELSADGHNIDIPDEYILEAVDNDGNGEADAYYIDQNLDGAADAYAIDANENGVVEQMSVDSTGDGNADMVQIDEDEDGQWDAVESVEEPTPDVEEEPVYNEEIYEEDIPGMTNADDMTDWQSEEEIVADNNTDFDATDIG